MEEYKRIKNNASDVRNARNATVRILTTGGQKLKLWGPTREIIY